MFSKENRFWRYPVYAAQLDCKSLDFLRGFVFPVMANGMIVTQEILETMIAEYKKGSTGVGNDFDIDDVMYSTRSILKEEDGEEKKLAEKLIISISKSESEYVLGDLNTIH